MITLECPDCSRFHFDGNYLDYLGLKSIRLLRQSKRIREELCTTCDKQRLLKRLEIASESCSVSIDYYGEHQLFMYIEQTCSNNVSKKSDLMDM